MRKTATSSRSDARGTDEYSLTMIFDELRNRNLQHRLSCMKRLSTIAYAVGPEKTRRDLIPFLTAIREDADEVLMVLAEQIGMLAPFVGGPEYIHILLPVLEPLAAMEETLVRNTAIESLRYLATMQTNRDLEVYFVPMMRRLANAATRFDDMCMVVETEYLKNFLLPLLRRLAVDDQDFVRLHALQACALMAIGLPSQDVENVIVPMIHAAVADHSWKVRLAVAQSLVDIEKAISKDTMKQDLLLSLARLINDEEVEVRICAILSVKDFCAHLPQKDRTDLLITSVLPHLKQFVADHSEHVRVALATTTTSLCAVIGKENSVELLVPFYVILLRDSSANVRLTILASLEQVNKVIGSTQLAHHILPVVIEFSADANWRVRRAIVEFIPFLCAQMGQTYFDLKLKSIFMAGLFDNVSGMREATIINMRRLIDQFGRAWVIANVIPVVIILAEMKTNYINRITCLFTINMLADACGSDLTIKVLMPIVLSLVEDHVPNVRFNVARTYRVIGTVVDASIIQTQLKPILMKLKDDPDPDVKFYAIDAMQALKI